jgi:hypothetical protein
MMCQPATLPVSVYEAAAALHDAVQANHFGVMPIINIMKEAASG